MYKYSILGRKVFYKGSFFVYNCNLKTDIQFDCYILRLELLLKHKIYKKFYDNFLPKYIVDIE